MFCARWHQSVFTYSQPFFQFHLEEKWDMEFFMDVQTRHKSKH